MKFFGNNKKDTGETSSSPVVSEKTKQSASLFKRTASKIGDVLKNKFSKSEESSFEPMSNAKYLGEIYKIMVQNRDDAKLDRQQKINRREEEESEDQKRHEEIIKALSLRRIPKPKKVIRRERKAEEVAKKKAPPKQPTKPQPKPQPQAPKPEAPKPQPQAPKPEAPKPQPQAPKPEAPKPQPQPPKPEPPKPQPQAPKPEAPKPQPQPPKPEPPKPQPPKPEPPKPQPPKPEPPKPQPPKPEPPKPQPPKKAEPVREAPKQPPKKAEPVKEPPKQPSAQQAPAPKPPAPSAEPLKYGYLSAAGLTAVISAHEGNAESVYGDIGVAGKGKVIKNKYSDRPEVWSQRELGKEKKLTEFTFEELLRYQKYRNNIKTSTGAVGIAGFMPSTIFGPKLDGKAGLFKQSGLSWNDKFTEENQKLLKSVMDDEADKILSNGLKKLGINSITPGTKIAANYVGATGLLWVVEEGQKNPNITVRDALMKRNGGKDVTKIKQSGDEKPENTINADLRTTLAKDFIKKKDEYALSQAKKLGLVDKNTGLAIDQTSKQNADMKQPGKTTTTVVNQSTNNNYVSEESANTNRVDDRPAHKRK